MLIYFYRSQNISYFVANKQYKTRQHMHHCDYVLKQAKQVGNVKNWEFNYSSTYLSQR